MSYFDNLTARETKIKKDNIKQSKELISKGKKKEAIELAKKRPTSDITKRSSHTVAFRKKYGDIKVPSEELAKLVGISVVNQNKIIKKGMGAYLSAGSRSSVSSPRQWGLARLYSVIMGGKARKIDKDLLF